MIHLDTNFLIGVVNRDLPIEQALTKWVRQGETFAASSIVWAEFLNGPVSSQYVQQMNVLIGGRVVPFGKAEAEMAARLFNQSGRRRTSQPDCFIAATAICAQAALATQNQKHFALFTAAGLQMA